MFYEMPLKLSFMKCCERKISHCILAFRNSAKFTRKHLRQRPATLLKKSLWHRCFPVTFAKFLRTPFLQNTSGRLLLTCYSHKHFFSFLTFHLFVVVFITQNICKFSGFFFLQSNAEA